MRSPRIRRGWAACVAAEPAMPDDREERPKQPLTCGTLTAIGRGVAMEMYAVRPHHNRHGDYDIDTLFWGALIFLAVFVCCLLVWKAIDRLHNGTKFDGGGAVNRQRVSATPERSTAQFRPVTKPPRRQTELVDGATVEGGHVKDPEDGPLVDSLLDRAGFSEREEEEFLLTYGPRKVRKAIRDAERRVSKRKSDARAPTDSRIRPAVLDPHRWRAEECL